MSRKYRISASMLAGCAYALLAFLCVGQRPAMAVIIDSGDGQGNTTAPVDDPGFANVGRPSTASGTYLGVNGLGEHWVVSAWHTGGGDITGQDFFFPGDVTAYSVLEVVRLQNPDTSNADLKVFRVSGAPGGLNNLPISAATPGVGSEVVMIGRGRRREVDKTFWSDDLINDSGTWPEVAEGSANRAGYDWTASGLTLRWGTNQLADDGQPDPDIQFVIPDEGFGTTIGIGTVFNSGLPTAHEAQAATGDSGGGVFYKNGGNWELAGVMIQRSLFNDQPNTSSVYGNATLIADLSVYRDQIVSVTGLNSVPEPSSFVLCGLGMVGLAAAGWRQRRKRS